MRVLAGLSVYGADRDIAAVDGLDLEVVSLQESHANQRQSFGFMNSHRAELTLSDDCCFVRFEDAKITITKFNIDGANLLQIQVPDRVCRKR